MEDSRLHLAVRFWQKVPVLVRAVITGAVILLLGVLPWSSLIAVNAQFVPKVPWAVLVMAFYGGLLIKYLNGWGWPRSTALARRFNLRLRPLSGRVWIWAFAAGGSAVGALLALAFVGLRLGTLPAEAFDQYAQLAAYPAGSVLLWLLMSALVAGVVEEAAFRGYMQVPIEQRHGIVVALATVGVIFYAVHFAPLAALPGFLLGAIAWGLLAYLTGSTLPGMILHAAVDAISFLWAWSNYEQARRLAVAPVWSNGTDTGFWLAVCLFVGLGLASLPAYYMLARFTQLARKASR
jgi:membrane protease YdiL (CAAX protease family)